MYSGIASAEKDNCDAKDKIRSYKKPERANDVFNVAQVVR